MNKLLLLVLCFLTINTVFAQTKKPITHETMTAMKRVGSPEVSPDGRWVVFSVTEPSYVEKDVVNDLWIVAADGSTAPRKITFGKGAESGYKWSPDGKSIAFSAKREEDEVSQIYILNIAEGGEAQRFSNISTGVGNPQWSPDGRMILYTTKVYPGNFTDSANKIVAEERKKQKYNARVYTSFPIRNFDVWNDEKQTHAFVQSVVPGSAPRNIFTNVSATVKEGFFFGGNIVWAPNSKEVVFVAVIDRTTAAYQDPTSELYRLSIDGGDAVKISNSANHNNPAFSKDGKYLFFISSPNNNQKVYNLGKLTRIDWPSLSNRTTVVTSFDRPINNYVVAPANKIYMSVEDQGNDKIFVADVSKGNATPLTTMNGAFTSVTVSSDGKVVVSNFESAVKPAEIVRFNSTTTSSNPLFITKFNDAALATLDMHEPEIFWTTSSRGKQIRSMLIRPAGFDQSKKYPLFVVMHGGPASAWKNNWGYRWNYQLLAAPGYVVLLTDYTGSTGYGEKFSQDIQFDPLKGPAQEINEAADDAIKRFAFIDSSRQAAGGGSYGGHLANWMQASTTRYKTLISHAGLVNSEAQFLTSDYMYGREVMIGSTPWVNQAAWNEQNPIRYAANFKTPVLITIGERDYRVPINNSIENFGLLQRLKIPSKLIVFPDENHWILKPENSRFWYSEVQGWLTKYIQ